MVLSHFSSAAYNFRVTLALAIDLHLRFQQKFFVRRNL